MGQPLALIGPATLEVIGLTPLGFAEVAEANWARHAVFDSEPFYQPVSGGERRETLHLACRPHVMGGLQNYRALARICAERRPVPFIRMSGLVGGYQGLVAVTTVSREETKIAPDGTGWRWEFTVEMLHVGMSQGGWI